MFILGHLGIGSKLVSPWSKGLPLRWILVGTLLPDLIDKPLYYFLSLTTGLQGAEMGLISGTRTFGHTGLLLLAMIVAAILGKSRALAALSAGMMTHLLLDNGVEHFFPSELDPAHLALLFPLKGARFPAYPFEGMLNHLQSSLTQVAMIAEAVGGGFLAWDYWKSMHSREILARFRLLRRKRFLRRFRKLNLTKGA